jgi:hypothetical protein
MSTKPPARFLRGLNAEEQGVVLQWWAGLPPETRAQVKAQCHERLERTLSAPATKSSESADRADEASQPLDCSRAAQWQRLGFQLEGVLVEGDEPGANSEWNEDLYEYMVNHEFTLLGEQRVYHICHAHPAPQAAARAGVIPANFACPFQKSDCLMRDILDQYPGRSIRLRRKIIAPTEKSRTT